MQGISRASADNAGHQQNAGHQRNAGHQMQGISRGRKCRASAGHQPKMQGISGMQGISWNAGHRLECRARQGISGMQGISSLRPPALVAGMQGISWNAGHRRNSGHHLLMRRRACRLMRCIPSEVTLLLLMSRRCRTNSSWGYVCMHACMCDTF
jgi:hypothetical protein